MVFLALVLPPRVARMTSIALSSAYALTIVAGAIGEWNYYILGSGHRLLRVDLAERNSPDLPGRTTGCHIIGNG